MSAPSPRSRFSWRVVDIVVASALGVAAGVVFWAWNLIHDPVTAPLAALLPGLNALFYGLWLFAGVLGGLIIRKPGAAVFVEVVAASVSAILGASWGYLTIEAGLVQGLAAELVFLAFLYRNWRLPVALLAGAAAGLAMAVNDLILWYPAADTPFMVVYTIASVVSGTLLAGLGSWALARGLAATGALNRFAAGRESTARV